MKIPTRSLPDFKHIASTVVQEKNIEDKLRYFFTIGLNIAAQHLRDEINCNQAKFRANPLNFVSWRLDEIESSIQRWSHIELYEIALRLKFYAKDLFVLTQKSRPCIQHKKQQHARKNHSYLWVFKKPGKQEMVELKRAGIWKTRKKSRAK